MPGKHSNHDEPERIGRTGGEGGDRSQLIRVPSGGPRGSARGSTTLGQFAGAQRVTVKIHYVRHLSPQKGRDSVRRHVRYLTRETVTRDITSGRFYDARRDGLEPKEVIQTMAEGPRHFRLIISPEEAHSLNDLTAYTREVMARVERDLGALQWRAVNHTNTSHDHIHVLISSKLHDGSTLTIPKHYVSHGFRERASQVATEWLGERTREQAQLALASEVRAQRWTSLDATLERFSQPAGEGRKINLSNIKLSRYALTTPELLDGRLRFLKEHELVHPETPGRKTFIKQQPTWQLAPNWKEQLFELGARHDIIKQLHATLGGDAARVAEQLERVSTVRSFAERAPSVVRGVVIAKGAVNELRDERFVVLSDSTGKPHEARIWASQSYDAVQIGGVLEVGRSAQRRWRIAHEISAVAEFAKDGLYSTGRHRKWLEVHQPKLTGERMERRLRTVGLQVSQLAKQAESGVVRAANEGFKVERSQLERFIAGRNRWPDLRVVAAYSLEEQVTAKAYSWIDRQIIRVQLQTNVPATDITRNTAVQTAMAKRGEWLLEQGFAKRQVPEGTIQFIPGAIAKLIAHEEKEFAQKCKSSLGKSVQYLKEGQGVAGVLRGVTFTHRGAVALIEGSSALFAAPVSREPLMERGQRVIARSVARNYARIDLDRGNKALKLGIER